jgi:hypothetical protein
MKTTDNAAEIPAATVKGRQSRSPRPVTGRRAAAGDVARLPAGLVEMLETRAGEEILDTSPPLW